MNINEVPKLRQEIILDCVDWEASYLAVTNILPFYIELSVFNYLSQVDIKPL
jgi:hypothetical protein